MMMMMMMMMISYKVKLYFNNDIYFRRYSRAEQEDIVECVVKHKAYGLVKGTNFWKMMEENMVSVINIKLKGT
jgi:hypothetical protein